MEGEMMKKFFACFTVVLLVLSLGAGAMAEENESEGELQIGTVVPREDTITDSGAFEEKTAYMTVSFDISESYEVTIPASIKLDGSFSNGFTGKAEIEAVPQLNGRSLVVSLAPGTLAEPMYYKEGTAAPVQWNAVEADQNLIKVSFSPELKNSDGTSAGKTASVEVSGKSPLKAFGANAELGVKVLTAAGTAPSSNELTYTVNGLDKLAAGSYNFLQTFRIIVG